MTIASGGAALLVVAWSQVHDLLVFYLVWIGLGLAMACLLYEAAFTVVAKWFHERRRQALTAVTLVGGFASFVFSPLSNWLIDEQGWRSALITLAVILAAATVPLHGVFLRAAPRRGGAATPTVVPGDAPTSLAEPAAAFRSGCWLERVLVPDRRLRLELVCDLGGRRSPHPLLARGWPKRELRRRRCWLMGVMQVPGRIVFAAAARVLPRHHEAPAVFLLQGAGLAVLAAATSVPGVIIAVCVFGAGNGMATLGRATALVDAYGSADYGSIAGVAAAFATGARAVAPVAAAGAYAAFGGYQPLLWLMVAGAVLASGSARLANRRLTLVGERA
jgi:hypothetical protein